MSTQLHWVEGPWLGRLALAARPRGEDWLEDEMAGWHRAGIDTVVSLLEADEERDLGLACESSAVRQQGMHFRSIPIPDRQVPDSRRSFVSAIDLLDRDLVGGKNLVVHCRQGVGRTGLVAACLLLHRGVDVETSLQRLRSARGVEMPETAEQRRWIEDFAGAAIPSRW